MIAGRESLALRFAIKCSWLRQSKAFDNSVSKALKCLLLSTDLFQFPSNTKTLLSTMFYIMFQKYYIENY